MREAIYIAPNPDEALWTRAAQWLGRDAWTGAAITQPAIPDLAELTAAPRRYGFHGTMVAPFALHKGRAVAELDAALAAFCAARRGFALPLELGRIGLFFALVPAKPSTRLHTLAEDAVRTFHPFRAPMSEADRARRRPERLGPRQRELLDRWHYPYVMEEFRFHMTLTGPVPDNRADGVADALQRHFAGLLDAPLQVDGLARYKEAEAGGPFRLIRREAFGG